MKLWSHQLKVSIKARNWTSRTTRSLADMNVSLPAALWVAFLPFRSAAGSKNWGKTKATPGRGGNPQQPSVTSPSTQTFSVKCLQKSAQQEPPVSTLVSRQTWCGQIPVCVTLLPPPSAHLGRRVSYLMRRRRRLPPQKLAKMSGHNAPKRLKSIFNSSP